MAHTSTPWRLAIDFGTTNTAAAVCPVGEPNRARVVKLSSASSEMPSAVLAHADGRLLAGEVARNSAGSSSPDAYESAPKRRVGEGQVLLGGRVFSDVDLVAAVLGSAANRAARQFDGAPPAELLLTHPAAWASTRKGLMVEAARAAGLPEPEMVPEPVAAARYYTAIDGPGAATGLVAVYDIGGGTVDVAIIDVSADGLELRSVDGIDHLGGEVFDGRLFDLVLARHGEVLGTPPWEGPDGLARRSTLQDEVRRAKHVLSEEQVADVAVGGDVGLVTVTRREFEEIIFVDLARSADMLARTIDSAGFKPADLQRLYLVGAASQTPLVAELLSERLDLAPATFDDPKTVTALGALTVDASRHGATPPVQPLARRPTPDRENGRSLVEGPNDRLDPDESTERAPVVAVPRSVLSEGHTGEDSHALSPAARRLLGGHPELHDWVLAHPKAVAALDDVRNVFALATSPALLRKALVRPATVSMLPNYVRFDAVTVACSAGEPAPVAASLFGPSLAAQLDALGDDVAQTLRSESGALALVSASDQDLAAVETDPTSVRGLLARDAATPDWMSAFVEPMAVASADVSETTTEPRGTERAAGRTMLAALALAVGAIGLALAGWSLVAVVPTTGQSLPPNGDATLWQVVWQAGGSLIAGSVGWGAVQWGLGELVRGPGGGFHWLE